MEDDASVVKLTGLDDDPNDPDFTVQQLTTSPPKRKRGRPRKSDIVAEPTPKRGRPARGSKRGRPRKSQSPATAAAAVPKKTPGKGGRGRPRKKRVVEEEKGQKCGVCGKVFKLKTLLVVHMRIKHHQRTFTHDLHRKTETLSLYSKVIVQPDFESNRNVFGCNRCGEVFNMWTRWRKHYVRKHLNSRYRCRKCKIGFSYPLDLHHHKHRKHKAKIVLKKR